MISAEAFLEEARQAGFRLYTGVPCSYLKPFINTVIDAPELTYVGAANEGDAVAIATGAALAGQGAVVMFQNSGFGNAVNPLTSLNAIFQVPVLVITTWRGEPGGAADEPQHALMGAITPGLFELMGIPWRFFPEREEDIAPVLAEAQAHMASTRTPFALIMRKDAVAKQALRSTGAPREQHPLPVLAEWPSERPTRREALAVIQAQAAPTDAILATTGYTGRVLYALDDRSNQVYMVGSMGCVASLGLGLALAEPARRVLAIDGDGALLMRMGVLATVGYERPANLVHVLLDNEVHDSTGGQATVSANVDFARVAHACGYRRVARAGNLAELEAALAEAGDGPTFIHVKIAPGEAGDLPRPTITPAEVAHRFSHWLESTRAALPIEMFA